VGPAQARQGFQDKRSEAAGLGPGHRWLIGVLMQVLSALTVDPRKKGSVCGLYVGGLVMLSKLRSLGVTHGPGPRQV
jgi:hypothetical protein